MLDCSLVHTLQGDEGPFSFSVDLSVENGALVALYGKSGSGKTTLLRMIAGLTTPESGRIYVDGQCWFDSTKKVNLPPQKRGVGYVFQDYALFPNMTVRKNLEYALPAGSKESTVDDILDMVGLRELSGRFPDRLSGGQQQRVALARALASSPRILLLDEPLSALDQEMRDTLQGELGAVHKKIPVCTILVSHDFREIFRLSNKVYRIDHGAITASGTPAQVFCSRDTRDASVGQIIGKKNAGDRTVLMVVQGGTVEPVLIPSAEAEGFSEGDFVAVAKKCETTLRLIPGVSENRFDKKKV